MIWYTGLMLFSVAIMFALNRLVWGGSAVITPIAILFVFAGTFQFTAMGMTLGLFVRDMETATTVANAIGFPMMFLSGTFFQLEAMPSALQTVAWALPLTYVNEGLRATMVFGNDATAFTYLLITAALAVVFFVISAWGLSWKSK